MLSSSPTPQPPDFLCEASDSLLPSYFGSRGLGVAMVPADSDVFIFAAWGPKAIKSVGLDAKL